MPELKAQPHGNRFIALEGDSMIDPGSHNMNVPFGLLELDAQGKVIRYGPTFERGSAPTREEIIGRNFFTQVAPTPEIQELKDRFENFMANGEALDRFAVKFASDQGIVDVQFLLAHMAQSSSNPRLALVRIAPIANPARS